MISLGFGPLLGSAVQPAKIMPTRVQEMTSPRVLICTKLETIRNRDANVALQRAGTSPTCPAGQ